MYRKFTVWGVEILLVDDGSSDNSPIICDNWAKRDKRIKVIHQSNQGVSVARNTGIRNAIGDWIWFVDADDMVVDGYYEKIKVAMNDSFDMILFGVNNIDISGNRTAGFSPDLSKSFTRNELFEKRIFCGNVFSSLYRRDFIRNNDIWFPEGMKYAEDWTFSLTCYIKSLNVYVLQEHLYEHFCNPTSVMNSGLGEQYINNVFDMYKNVLSACHNLSFKEEKAVYSYLCSLGVWNYKNVVRKSNHLSKIYYVNILKISKSFPLFAFLLLIFVPLKSIKNRI